MYDGNIEGRFNRDSSRVQSEHVNEGDLYLVYCFCLIDSLSLVDRYSTSSGIEGIDPCIIGRGWGRLLDPLVCGLAIDI